MNQDEKDLIGAAIRTKLVGLPSLPGLPNFAAMIAQGWSERVNRSFQLRVEEFFSWIKARLESLESLQENHLTRLIDIEAQAALLEEAVAAASREPIPGKRQAFADFYISAITGKLGSEPDPIRSLLQTLEELTPSDLALLRQIVAYKQEATGDSLTNTTLPSTWVIAERTEREWEELISPIQLSITKLETRGLIFETPRMSGIMTSGNMSAWYNQFRRKAWRITKPGRQLLFAIPEN